MNINKLFIPYELALFAKEKGFIPSPSFAEYRQWDGSEPWLNLYQDWSPEDTEKFTKECEAPLYQQIIDWFRIEHKLILTTEIGFPLKYTHRVYDISSIKPKRTYNSGGPTICIEDYYESLNKAVEEALKLI